MGKRYYCDYCDNTIPSNVVNRKKHNEGSYHQIMKNKYYSQFKDLKTIVDEERQKKPCYKFFTSGYCHFDTQCRLTHKTPHEIQYLEDLYRLECHNKAVKEEACRPKVKKPKHKKNGYEPKLLSEHLSREDEELLEKILPKFKLANSLKKFDITGLPPSLIPPTFSDLVDHDINTWKIN